MDACLSLPRWRAPPCDPGPWAGQPPDTGPGRQRHRYQQRLHLQDHGESCTHSDRKAIVSQKVIFCLVFFSRAFSSPSVSVSPACLHPFLPVNLNSFLSPSPSLHLSFALLRPPYLTLLLHFSPHPLRCATTPLLQSCSLPAAWCGGRSG